MKRLILSTVGALTIFGSYTVYVTCGDPSVDGMLLSAVIGAIGIMCGINVIEAFRRT
jgi:hypothetical protein